MDDVERNYRARIHTLEGAVRVQDEYIRQQTAKLRELEAFCRNEALSGSVGAMLAYRDCANRVEAILGLVVSGEEPLT